MATIMPFRGTRYDPAKAGDPSRNATLPYDRITPELQDKYYGQGGYNICRVIKGKAQDGDNGANVYTRAGAAWREWIDGGIVAEDREPAIYAYYQVFNWGGSEYVRRGMCAMIELEDYESGGVKPHERTLDAPKQDRFNLLTATHSHFGQIFQLYPDDGNVVAGILAPHCRRKPDVDVGIDEQQGVRHKLWAVTDPDVISRVQQAMKDKPLFIADGHHRYETALNYRNHVLEHHAGGAGGHNPRYAMMTLIGMSDPGLVVLPTHRVLHGLEGFDEAGLIRALYEHFRVEGGLSLAEVQARLELAAQDRARNALGLYYGGKFWFLELTDGGIMERLAPDRTDAWRGLDVAVLHEVVLEKILGIGKAAQAAKTNLNYERHVDRAIGMVDRGTHQAVLMMNPTKLEQIRDVAGHGEVMPQKSTDFYPKLASGLVACQVDLG